MHLLTQSLNAEAACLRHEAGLENLVLFAPLPSCSQMKGALTQLHLQCEDPLLSPLSWTSGAVGPESTPSCLWGEQEWQPTPKQGDGGKQGLGQAPQCSSQGSPSHLLSWCWRLARKAGVWDRWRPLCSLPPVPHPHCSAFVSQHD